jgi:peptidoglycan/xylan/chitin deacetylase (PgdA/CDA1 family)
MRAIITFHSIDDSGSILSYPVGLFEKLLEQLQATAIPVVTLDHLLASDANMGVALTFDDGMRSVLTDALPIMQKYGACGHLYLTTGAIGQGMPNQSGDMPTFEMLSWDEVAELQTAGFSIEAHTRTHPDMRTLSVEEMTAECRGADDEIERRIGVRPKYFAYPFGYHNQVVRDCVRGLYRATVTTELSYLGGDLDSAALPRLDSYYLQSDWALRNLAGVSLRSYFVLRSQLRNIRGSQCAANCN